MTGHNLVSVKKEGRVVTVKCACGDTFDSIESEVLARWYLSRHLSSVAKKEVTK